MNRLRSLVRAAMLVGVLAALLVLSAVMLPATAQNDDVDCDLDLDKSFIQDKFDEAIASDDLLEGMREFRMFLTALDADCRGKSFSREQDGANPVLGPINFENGVWRDTFTTERYGAVGFERLEGDCDLERTELLFNVFEGEAVEGVQERFGTEGQCQALINISNTSGDWSLVFELIRR
jgi:hypothetical protein